VLLRLTHCVLTVVEKSEIDAAGRHIGTPIPVHLVVAVGLRILVDVVAIHAFPPLKRAFIITIVSGC
jgi:hypothetical protein